MVPVMNVDFHFLCSTDNQVVFSPADPGGLPGYNKPSHSTVEIYEAQKDTTVCTQATLVLSRS